MDEPVFLDANVLMYAGGADHPLRQPCQRALQRAAGEGIELVTDAEVLQEILHRYFAIRRPAAGRTVYRAAVRLCEEILPIEERDTARALDLLEEHPGLTPRDALHVAVMEHHGLRRLLSTDRDFDRLDQVERVAPADFAD